MRGIEQYVTQDGIRCLKLHYSADPDKDPDTARGKRWFTSHIKGFPGGQAGAKWQQEYEINFLIVDGARVWPNFDEMLPYITYEPGDIEISEYWPIYAGFDWGIANNTVFNVHAVADPEHVYQIDEIVDTGDTNPHEFSKGIKRKWWFSRLESIVGDPSIWTRMPRPVKDGANEPPMTSIGEMFADEGIYIQKGRKEPGIDMAYIALLNGYFWQDYKQPKFRISTECKHTIRCLRRLRKKQNLTQGARDNNDEPEQIITKNVDEFDANKYCHLSMGFEESEIVDIMPGTFDWYVRQMEEQARREFNVLR